MTFFSFLVFFPVPTQKNALDTDRATTHKKGKSKQSSYPRRSSEGGKNDPVSPEFFPLGTHFFQAAEKSISK
jgi:hypothetical protein